MTYKRRQGKLWKQRTKLRKGWTQSQKCGKVSTVSLMAQNNSLIERNK